MARHQAAVEQSLRDMPEAQRSVLTPLDALLFLVRECARLGDRWGLQAAATAAAPYVHPRLNASDIRVRHTYEAKSDAELAEELVQLEAKARLTQLQDRTIEGKAPMDITDAQLGPIE
jgi:hypothetical protein